MDSSVVAISAALPWIVAPLVSILRGAQSRSLANERSASPDDPAPLVSVIIPARDEARNIAACLRSVLSTTYPAVEVIVVNDHSADATGAIAREIAASDPRVRVIDSPDLPAGWFGKQWACQSGAMATNGAILCFTDADTRHAPDLLPRAVNGMSRTGADLYSVGGSQQLGSFWERLIQPQMFAMLAARYGGTEIVNRSPRAYDKIANGQFIMIQRATYDALGGHAIVRHVVAEDLMLAQRYFALGKRVVLVLGMEQLSTRMYTSLHELIAGWGKNVFAGGRAAVPPGSLARWLFPLLLTVPPLFQLAPVVALLATLVVVVPPALVLWAVIATTTEIVWWTFVYMALRVNVLYALLFPLGATVLLFICASAIVRGERVSWKGRQYVSG